MPTFTRAGDLNRRITLQLPVTVQDETTGNLEITWVDLATVSAACEPDRGREYFASFGVVAAQPMLFRMRYHLLVTPLVRVLYRGLIYSADWVEDYRDSRTETRIYAQAGANLG